MDLISSIYAEVKPKPGRPHWPCPSPEEKDRAAYFRDKLIAAPTESVATEAMAELKALAEVQGARIRDAGISRQELVDSMAGFNSTAPSHKNARTARLRGWDERDAALKFWHRAYCA